MIDCGTSAQLSVRNLVCISMDRDLAWSSRESDRCPPNWACCDVRPSLMDLNGHGQSLSVMSFSRCLDHCVFGKACPT